MYFIISCHGCCLIINLSFTNLKQLIGFATYLDIMTCGIGSDGPEVLLSWAPLTLSY